MEFKLSANCRKTFGHGDRSRGAKYHASERVKVRSVGERGLIAVATGTYGERYDVCIDVSNIADEELGVYCSCMRFEDGVNCKHLWAAVLQADQYFTVDSLRNGEYFLYDCDPSEFRVGPPLKSSDSNRLINVSRPPKAQPSWEQQLAFALEAGNVSPRRPAVPAARQLSVKNWFAIALSDLANAERFVIRTYQSNIKKDGNWSVPTQHFVSQGAVEQVSDPAERRILTLLQAKVQHRYSYSLDTNEYSLSKELLEESLRELCSSGRFVWTMEDGQSLRDYHPIQLDDQGSWQFELRVAPGRDKDVLVQPLLVRSNANGSEAIRNIGQVVGICESGALLFESEIGILRKEDTHWVRRWSRVGEFCLPQKELKAFCSRLLEQTSLPKLTFHESLGVSHAREKPTGKLLLDYPEGISSNHLQARVLFKYADQDVASDEGRDVVWHSETKQILERDFETESGLLADLEQFDFQLHHSGLSIAPTLRIHRNQLADVVIKLSSAEWEVIAHGKKMRSSGTVDIRVESGEDWFDLKADIKFDGQTASLPTLLRALRSGEKQILLDDGTHGILPEDWLKRFGNLDQLGEESDSSIRFNQNQALMLDAMLADHEQIQVDRSFSSICKKLKSFSGVKPRKQPRTFRGDLRTYQNEALGWFRFLNDFEFGGCLADDMGLGKTVQVLALLESRRVRRLKADEVRKPSIVIVPKSLVFNWVEEANRFCPNLKVLDYTGLCREERRNEIPDSHLVVTTYATCRLDILKLAEFDFDYAILDEAQAVKNPKAQTSKAIRLLKSKNRLAMTGTPVENHLGDLWAIFDFLNPGMLGNSTARMATAKEGESSRLNALSIALQPFILRRTKQQVLTELPEKTEQTLHCEMNPKQKKLYRELRDHYRASLNRKIKDVGLKRAKIHVLEALLRLRQVACDPRLVDPKSKTKGAKLEVLFEQISEVISEGHKVLVFSQFTKLLGLVREELKTRGIEYAYIDGKSSKRDQIVHRFQNDENCQLFLISLKAGGHGLNLTAADYVFILDPWWNPAVEAQAIDRAHRLGQQNPVSAYRLIAKDTVEDKIVSLQDSKRELADAILNGDRGPLANMSLNDLSILFE